MVRAGPWRRGPWLLQTKAGARAGVRGAGLLCQAQAGRETDQLGDK